MVKAILIALAPVMAIGCMQGVQQAALPTADATAPSIPASAPVESVVSCTEDVIAERRRHQDVLIEVKNRHQDSLRAIPGVTGLGVGLIRKDGGLTSEIGIIVFVDPKLLPDQFNPERRIPSTLEGCAVDMQPAPMPVPAAGS